MNITNPTTTFISLWVHVARTPKFFDRYSSSLWINTKDYIESRFLNYNPGELTNKSNSIKICNLWSIRMSETTSCRVFKNFYSTIPFHKSVTKTHVNVIVSDSAKIVIEDRLKKLTWKYRKHLNIRGKNQATVSNILGEKEKITPSRVKFATYL